MTQKERARLIAEDLEDEWAEAEPHSPGEEALYDAVVRILESLRRDT